MQWIDALCEAVARDGLVAVDPHLSERDRAVFGRMVAGLGPDFRPEYRAEPAAARAAGGGLEVIVRRHHLAAPVWAARAAGGWRISPFGPAAALAGQHALAGVPDSVTDIGSLAAALTGDVAVAKATEVVSGSARLPLAIFAGFAVAPTRLAGVRLAAPVADPSARNGSVHLAGFEYPLRCLFDTETRQLRRLGGRPVAAVARAWLAS